MPIPIRIFIFNKMKKYFEEQNKSDSEDVVSKSINNMKSVEKIYKKYQNNSTQK